MIRQVKGFDWDTTELVVFDIDGTLYDQRPLRRRMAFELAKHCLTRPWKVGDLRIISCFRRTREQLAGEESTGVIEKQFERPATELQVDPARIRQVVEFWMEERPLGFLRRCRYPSVGAFMDELRAQQKSLAVLSDYPTRRKLDALELEVELQVSAVDPQVDRLKPHPRGLERVLELAGVDPGRAVLIGDRDDRDGECARRAGVRYLLKGGGGRSGIGFTDYSQLHRAVRMSGAEKSTLQ